VLPANIHQTGILVKTHSPSDSDTHGKPATVIGIDNNNHSYLVQLSGSLQTLSLAPEAVRLPPNTLVRIVGLQSAAQHNDKWARVVSFDETVGRYEVALSAEHELKVRPANVRL
jgi:hypothetical protein